MYECTNFIEIGIVFLFLKSVLFCVNGECVTIRCSIHTVRHKNTIPFSFRQMSTWCSAVALRSTGRSGQEAGGPCRKQADVLFLIDTTSNMDYDYFQRYMLGFVSDVVQQLDVDTGRTRVAVISFSDTAQVSPQCVVLS